MWFFPDSKNVLEKGVEKILRVERWRSKMSSSKYDVAMVLWLSV